MVTQYAGSGSTDYCIVDQPSDHLNVYPSDSPDTPYRSVVRWTAPVSGTVELSGNFEGLNQSGQPAPDTDAQVTLNHNGVATQLSDTTVNSSFSPQSFTLNPQVTKGDTIDFSVGTLGGSMSHDSTGLQADLTTPSSRTWYFNYDDLDRPTSFTVTDTMPDQTTHSTTTSYAIDYDGHRIAKWVNGVKTSYVYDGDTVVEEIGPKGTTYELPGVGYVSNATGSYVQYYYFDNAEAARSACSTTPVPCKAATNTTATGSRTRRLPALSRTSGSWGRRGI